MGATSDTIRSNRHPDKMRQDDREPPDTTKIDQESNQPPDMSSSTPDKMRNQSRTTDNRPDMIRTTYPRQLESMSSTPTPSEATDTPTN